MKRVVGEINKKLRILKNMKEREQYEAEVNADDDMMEDENQWLKEIAESSHVNLIQ